MYFTNCRNISSSSLDYIQDGSSVSHVGIITFYIKKD